MSSSQRQKTANQLNAAILTSKGQDKGTNTLGSYQAARLHSLSSELNSINIHSSVCFVHADSKLPTILKMLCWSQEQLAEKVEFPQLSLNGEWVNDEQTQMNTSR